MDVPAVTADQMREVDRIMIEDLGIDLVRMTENAGRGLAEVVIRRYGSAAAVTVLAGPGGNGAGGLVAARHLANRGHSVRVALAAPHERFAPVPGEQVDVLRRMNVPMDPVPSEADVIVDAILGYSLEGDPRGRAAELIGWSLEQEAPVCSLDTPSGLDVTSGVPARPCVRADSTVTVALPKTGLLLAPAWVGDLYLADISVPPSVYDRLGLPVPPDLFASDQIIRL